MREQLYTVTANQKTGESFVRQHLTFKQSSGLVKDLKSWGCVQVDVIAEVSPDALMIDADCRMAHRQACQIFALVVTVVTISCALFFMAVKWSKDQAKASAPSVIKIQDDDFILR